MSAPANPLDQLLARAQAAVRAADAAKAAKSRAKDGRKPLAEREAAQSEYVQWAESLQWTATAVERVTERWTCQCGAVHSSKIVHFYLLQEHRSRANATREVLCNPEEHKSLPLVMKVFDRHTKHCTECS